MDALISGNASSDEGPPHAGKNTLKAVENSKLLIAPIKIQNVQIDALFDTGANITAIGIQALDYIEKMSKQKYTIDKTERHYYSTVEGKGTTLGTVTFDTIVISIRHDSLTFVIGSIVNSTNNFSFVPSFCSFSHNVVKHPITPIFILMRL